MCARRGTSLPCGGAGQRGVSARAAVGVLTGLVESDVAVLADPAQKQLDPTERLDSVFVGFAFGVEVFDGAVEDVHLSRGDIDYTRSVVRRQSASRAQTAYLLCEKNSRNMNVWYDSGWSLGSPTYSSMLNVTTCLNLRWGVKPVLAAVRGAAHESFPSLTSLIRALYVGIGDEPVGKPSTNGFEAVGLKSLMLRPEYRNSDISSSNGNNSPATNVLCDVITDSCGIVADD